MATQIQFRLGEDDLAALRDAADGVSVNEKAKQVVLDWLHGTKFEVLPVEVEVPHRRLGRLPTHEELTEIADGWVRANEMHQVREYRPELPAFGDAPS